MDNGKTLTPGLILRLAEAQTVPAVVIPVLMGSVYAWYSGSSYHVPAFIVCLLGASGLFLGINTLKSYYDFLGGTGGCNAPAGGMSGGGARILGEGRVAPYQALAVAMTFLAVALVACAALVIYRGFAPLVFGAAAALLGYLLVVPPYTSVFRGYFLGEAIVFVASGFLPTLAGYYVQTGRMDFVRLAAVSLPCALFNTAVFNLHHFTRMEPDRIAGIKTPAVLLGERRALAVSWLFPALAYLSIVPLAAGGCVRGLSLLALLTAPMLLDAKACLKTEGNPAELYWNLTSRTAMAGMASGAVLILAFIVPFSGG